MVKITPDLLPLKGCVLTIGNFDGIHLGHVSLINETVRLAREKGLPSLVLTFDTHPRNYFGKTGFKRVISYEEKERLVAELGVDYYYAIEFGEIMDMRSAEFCESILIKRLGAVHAVCGFDFAFGSGGKSNAETLARLLRMHGAGCTVMPPVLTAEGEKVSSTSLRQRIALGDMVGARKLLGRPYSITAPVVKGEQLGRRLGFPTANQKLDKMLVVPAHGVYAAICTVEGRHWQAVVNVGTKPTVNGFREPLCESHLLDFEGDIYGKELKVQLFRALREERRFQGTEELRQQIEKDKLVARRYFETVGKKHILRYAKETEI